MSDTDTQEEQGWHPDDPTKIYQTQRSSSMKPAPIAAQGTTSPATPMGTATVLAAHIMSQVKGNLLALLAIAQRNMAVASAEVERKAAEALYLLTSPCLPFPSGGSQSPPVPSGTMGSGSPPLDSPVKWHSTETQYRVN